MHASCLVSKKCVGRPAKTGSGLFAFENINRGQLLVSFGGRVVDLRRLLKLGREAAKLAVQIDEDRYLLSQVEGPGDWVNHSCEPNAGIQGQVSLVALRDIDIGEEILYDYAMTDGSSSDEFDCLCGTVECRGRVTGNDWALPELQMKYAGYFSTYLTARSQAWPRYSKVHTARRKAS